MLRLSLITLTALGAIACNDNSGSPGGNVLKTGTVRGGAGVAVDARHTLSAGVSSGAQVSTNGKSRLVAVLAD